MNAIFGREKKNENEFPVEPPRKNKKAHEK
jgi:hypothetical protein